MIKRNSVESIVVMFLFIAFTVSIGVLIVQAKTSYQKVLIQKQETQQQRIAVNYIITRIRQNDRQADIRLVDKNQLQLRLGGEDQGYDTCIVSHDNKLWEVLKKEDEVLDLNLGEKITDIGNEIWFDYTKTDQLLHIYWGKTKLQSIGVNCEVVGSD